MEICSVTNIQHSKNNGFRTEDFITNDKTY